jgi:NADH-quinone oxidoreductase subunit J
MLLNLGHPSELADVKGLGTRLAAGLVGLGLLAELGVIGRQHLPLQRPLLAEGANIVTPVAASLFTDYLLPFEITSVLLLAAIIGAVVLAKRRA